jgi:hypothetical protein
MKRRVLAIYGFLVFSLLAAFGCATTQSRFSPLSPEHFPALPESYDVQVFKSDTPTRPYKEIARLDVHLEITHFIPSSFDNALPELKKQARQSGSHAIIKIEEKRSRVGETMIYHVTATGVRYTDR